ncbi:MAG: hypothetical protein E7172_00625 [Firmicutes bacterium]|nr:hypothetical protein [Bacillota bacterium]
MTMIGEYLLTFVNFIFLFIDGIIYAVIEWLYSIFRILAHINLFSEEGFGDIVNRIYIVLGVFMLFVLAYSLLKAIINPDQFGSGDNSMPNLIKNVVISIVIIVLLPTVFETAFTVQDVVIKSGVFGNILKVGEDDLNSGGNNIAFHTLSAFLSPTDMAGEEPSASDDIDSTLDAENPDLHRNELTGLKSDYTFQEYYNGLAMKGNGKETDMSYFKLYTYADSINNGYANYIPILSTLAGAFILWCLLLFCFDLGIRIVKLAFFQIIAPIAVICRILPSENQKSIYKNWLSATINTYISVFLRVCVMYLGIFFIKFIINNFDDFIRDLPTYDIFNTSIISAFLIMGVVAFIKQSPSLFEQVFGIKSGDLNIFGMKALQSRASAGGVYAAGAIAGASITSAARNIHSRLSTGEKPLKGTDFFKAAGSGIAGLASGAKNGLVSGYKADSPEAMKKATSEAIQKTMKARMDRDATRQRHKDTSTTFVHDWYDTITDKSQTFVGYDRAKELTESIQAANSILEQKKKVESAARDFLKGEAKKVGVTNTFGISQAKGFSLVEDEDNNPVIFNYGQHEFKFNSADYRRFEQLVESARATGDPEYGQMADDFGKYEFAMVEHIMDTILMGESNFAKAKEVKNNGILTEEAKGLQTMVELRSVGYDVKRHLSDTFDLYAADADFKRTDFDIDADLSVTTKKGKNYTKMSTAIKTDIANKTRQLNELREKEVKKEQ